MKKEISKAVSVLAGGAAGLLAGGAMIGTRLNKRLRWRNQAFDKVVSLYFLLNQWLIIRQEGKSLVEYFEQNHYRTVAIYGMKELGERLYDELKDSGITVKYIIDRNAEAIYADVDVITPDNDLEPVDVIVVTAVTYFDEIDEMLARKVDYPVVSLEDILYEL